MNGLTMRTLAPSLALPLLLALAGCALGPNFQRPAPATPPAWSDAPAGVTAAPAETAWWTSFNDPELTALIGQAAAENLDAKAAVLRIAEARAQRKVAAAAQWPSLSANAGAQVDRLSETTPTGALFSKVGKFPGLSGVSIPNPYDQYQLGFDAAWEVDLFGRVRRSVEAAGADAQAAVEDSRAAQVSVLGEVGRAYVDLRGAQAKRAIVQTDIALERDLLDLAAQRRRAGLSPDTDVVRAAAEAESAEAQLPALDARSPSTSISSAG